ncbi:MAG: hypothetical protein GY801_51380 [bacterium]|nr:hypothetical protein [bacterium]
MNGVLSLNDFNIMRDTVVNLRNIAPMKLTNMTVSFLLMAAADCPLLRRLQ